MIIILSGCLVIGPGAAAELRQPVVRHAAVRLWIAPDVPVALRIVARRPAFDEPGMLVGGMVRHQIEDNLETGVMRRAHQRVEIRHGAEQRIDAGIVGNVVAEIGHRRWKDRRQPDRVDAERDEIGQPLDDALEVADAVAVGILKRARIDLIEDAVPPPIFVVLRSIFENHPQSRLARQRGNACGVRDQHAAWTAAMTGTRRAPANAEFCTNFSLGGPPKIGIVAG